jgi:hypothetical protein
VNKLHGSIPVVSTRALCPCLCSRFSGFRCLKVSMIWSHVIDENIACRYHSCRTRQIWNTSRRRSIIVAPCSAKQYHLTGTTSSPLSYSRYPCLMILSLILDIIMVSCSGHSIFTCNGLDSRRLDLLGGIIQGIHWTICQQQQRILIYCVTSCRIRWCSCSCKTQTRRWMMIRSSGIVPKPILLTTSWSTPLLNQVWCISVELCWYPSVICRQAIATDPATKMHYQVYFPHFPLMVLCRMV